MWCPIRNKLDGFLGSFYPHPQHHHHIHHTHKLNYGSWFYTPHFEFFFLLSLVCQFRSRLLVLFKPATESSCFWSAIANAHQSPRGTNPDNNLPACCRSTSSAVFLEFQWKLSGLCRVRVDIRVGFCPMASWPMSAINREVLKSNGKCRTFISDEEKISPFVSTPYRQKVLVCFTLK